MSEFFKTFKFKLIVCILALLAGFMLCSALSDGTPFSGTEFVNRITNPVKEYASSASGFVGEKLDALVNASEYKDENEKLRTEIAKLRQDLTDYENKKNELDELQKFIGIKEEHEDVVLSNPCTVISRTANDPYASFVIDRGSEDDISLYDPVVTSEGIVGIITEVAETYSTVETVLSPDIAIGAICRQTNDTGIVQGNIKYARDGKCEMIYIDRENRLEEGSIITTSGASGRFPKDFLIGSVEYTEADESGLSSYAVIKPYVDIQKVSSVMVITAFNGQEAGNAD
ncbi:MAG TPA: rod shape-determining protein MreC [Ruminococcus sp.]|nr:rod shape-determining protein MreC [Ruminococcus sp.]HBN11723.1 rod shape-determining protein MreC [Ruminococcus sp.]HCR74430.1 rod shape-determining protein MreC [Ruminococcus sp.]